MDDDDNTYIKNNQPLFPLFSNLAVELRLKIWSYAFINRAPQIVAVSTLKHDCADHKHIGWCPRYSSSPPPAVVNVCHESRQIAYEEAVKIGQLHFIPESNQAIESTTKPPGIIFNPNADILYIPSRDTSFSLFTDLAPASILLQVRRTPALHPLRSLAVNLRPHINPLRRPYDIAIIRSLEEIIFVSKQLGPNEPLAFTSTLAFLEGMRQRRRTRPGSYGDPPDRGTYPKICRFAMRGKGGVEILDHLGRFDVPWATVANIMKRGEE